MDQYRDRCLVSSVHRLHLLPLFDRILVLDEGRLVEQGSLDTLLATGGVLAALWRRHGGRPAGGSGRLT